MDISGYPDRCIIFGKICMIIAGSLESANSSILAARNLSVDMCLPVTSFCDVKRQHMDYVHGIILLKILASLLFPV